MSCCTIFHLCHDFASLIPWLHFAFVPSCPEGISHRRGIDPERLPGIPHCKMYLCSGVQIKRPQWPGSSISVSSYEYWGEKSQKKAP